MLKKKGAAIVKAELRRQLKAAREKEYRAASLAELRRAVERRAAAEDVRAVLLLS
jgi:Skp family chaperone for outer membrane proteins